MSPGAELKGPEMNGFPRVSGDEPDPIMLNFHALEFSPRERG